MDSFVESVQDNRVLVRTGSRDDAQAIKRLGARREMILWGRWRFSWADDAELAEVFSRLRDLGFAFSGGAGWSPADQFERLREAGLVAGRYNKIIWRGGGRSSVTSH